MSLTLFFCYTGAVNFPRRWSALLLWGCAAACRCEVTQQDQIIFLSPLNMLIGGTVVVLVFMGFVWVSHNKDILRRMKKQYPTTFVIVIMLSSYFLISYLGDVMVFMFGITLPLLLMFVHASLRLRNIKNKLENKMEGIGLKKTPMGIILDALEQQEDSINKLADYISKAKE
eukprot:XP_027323635.1 PRA1 family protein 3 isoform X2 [Anas platyrhynchos]